MGTMPEKKTLTVQRVLALVIAYITLSVGGGVAASLFLLPAVFGANSVAKAVIPSLSVEGIDFDVTSLPQKSTMYASDGTTKITEFWDQNREVVPLKKISKYMQQAVVAREDRRFFTHAALMCRVCSARRPNIHEGRPSGRFLPYPAVCQKRADPAGAAG